MDLESILKTGRDLVDEQVSSLGRACIITRPWSLLVRGDEGPRGGLLC